MTAEAAEGWVDLVNGFERREVQRRMLACLDVYYRESQATAACLLFHDWPDSVAAAQRVEVFSPVAPYEPGHFYRRELPPLLGILAALPSLPDLVVIDGYVWLDRAGRRGLGAHLHEALGGRVAVVGVAKTAFSGAPAIPVVRGTSRTPLFVSAEGMAPEEAAGHIARMHGEFRLPTLLKEVDRLSRGPGAI